MLNAITLSVSSLCGGNCLFCPAGIGKKDSLKLMPFSLFKKIVDEASSAEFLKKHPLTSFQFGGLGDDFLNTEFIEMLRYLRLKFPKIKVGIFTNFQNFTKDKSEIVARENLLNTVVCNIDGSNKNNYFHVKGMDLDVVSQNLKDFIRARNKFKSNCTLSIGAITLNHYIKTIKRQFGFLPSKLKDLSLKDIPDDFSLIKKQWEGLIDGKKDAIFRHSIFFWAERSRVTPGKINYQEYSCPWIETVKHQALLSPDGTWYACCQDYNLELAFGNVNEKTIDEIYEGSPRKKLIEMLENKKFAEIGSPCWWVNCCEKSFQESSFKSYLKKKISRSIIQKTKRLLGLSPKKNIDKP